MSFRVGSVSFERCLKRLLKGKSRNVSFSIQDTKGQYLLKIDLAPFTKDNVSVKVDQAVVQLTGKRGQKTGVSDWSHEVGMKFPLPSNVKLETVKTTVDEGVATVTGQTTG